MSRGATVRPCLCGDKLGSRESIHSGVPRPGKLGQEKGWRAGLGFPYSEVNAQQGWGLRGPCIVRSSALWVMVTWDPLSCDQNGWLMDRHDWKYYLPTTFLAGSSKCFLNNKKLDLKWQSYFSTGKYCNAKGKKSVSQGWSPPLPLCESPGALHSGKLGV